MLDLWNTVRNSGGDAMATKARSPVIEHFADLANEVGRFVG
jgi:hypothetical protein